MTSESRVVFGLKDVLGVRFQCLACGAVSIAPPGKWERVLPTCGQCGNQWLKTPDEQSAAERFRKGFEELRKLDNGGVVIHFEVGSPAS